MDSYSGLLQTPGSWQLPFTSVEAEVLDIIQGQKV